MHLSLEFENLIHTEDVIALQSYVYLSLGAKAYHSPELYSETVTTSTDSSNLCPTLGGFPFLVLLLSHSSYERCQQLDQLHNFLMLSTVIYLTW
jgi:hypothetical protein